MPLGKTLYNIHSGLPGDRALSQYDSFTWRKVLKRPFICDTRDASIHSLFMSHRQQTSSSLYDSLTEKMVLKRPFFSDTGEACASSLSRSPGRQSICQRTEFYVMVELYSENGLVMAV